MKFKVGDKVRIISNNGTIFDNKHIGKICTISEVDTDSMYPYRLKEINYPWEEEGLERVDNMDIQVIRKPVDKKEQILNTLGEYRPYLTNNYELADKIYEAINSNDEGEITEVKYLGNEAFIKNGENIEMIVQSNDMTAPYNRKWIAVPKDQAKQLGNALLQMCEGNKA